MQNIPMSQFEPCPEHKFSFGLWTVSNRGRDPFGDAVRPPLPPVDAVKLLAEAGAWGVNLHDNDLVPIDATPAERDRRAHGYGKSLLRSRLSGWSVHFERPARACFCRSENHARDGYWR